MSDLLKFTVPGSPEYVKIAKMSVESAAAVAGFTVDDIEDMGIAVADACKLITCHGFDGWSESYDIECAIDEDKITIEVKDDLCRHGIVKDLTRRPCMDCPNEGDLGMHVIRTLMDEVEIIKEEGKKKSIKMVKHK